MQNRQLCSKRKNNSLLGKTAMHALELAWLPKLWPCTKHINVCYNHFCEHVHHRKAKTFPINTGNQIADLFTKALTQNIFVKNCTYMWKQYMLFQDSIEKECELILQCSHVQKLTSHVDHYIASIISRLLGLFTNYFCPLMQPTLSCAWHHQIIHMFTSYYAWSITWFRYVSHMFCTYDDTRLILHATVDQSALQICVRLIILSLALVIAACCHCCCLEKQKNTIILTTTLPQSYLGCLACSQTT